MIEGLDALPRLTRAVFLLHRLDDLPYGEIGWRCGISADEVMSRMADALIALACCVDNGKGGFAGTIRLAARPWRDRLAEKKRKRRDCRLGLR